MTKEGERRLRKTDLLILSVVLVIAFVFRLYKINGPVADFHSWRQADTAAVSRNFVRNGFDLMHPHYDDLSNIQSGKENPQGYRFLEFPIYNATVAGLYKLLPFFSIEVWGRLVSILSSLIVLAIVYYFLVKEYTRSAAIVGSLVFAVFPFFVFFSRVILPEMNGLAFAFLAIFFCYQFIHSHKVRWGHFIAGLVCFAAAVLVKPTAVFYAIPLVYLFIYKYKFSVIKQLPFYLFFILSALPLIAWRKYILQYPEGIAANSWLITSVNTGGGLQPIFLRPAFFRWVFYERINNLILGGFTTFLLLIGLIVKVPRYFLHSIIAGALLYLFVFEGGNVQHAYYQTLILPALAIGVGLGAGYLLENATKFISQLGVYILITFCLLFSFFISYTQVKDYYGYSQDLVNTGRFINTHTQLNDKVVTDTTGDTTLLYLADRKGAPAVYKSLPELKQKGYSYFVTFNKDVVKNVKKETDYKVVGENEKFTMFKL